MGIIIGYGCVKNDEQRDKVLGFFNDMECDEVFFDICTQKSDERPQFEAALAFARYPDSLMAVFEKSLAWTLDERLAVYERTDREDIHFSVLIDHDFESETGPLLERMPCSEDKFEEEVSALRRYEQTDAEAVEHTRMYPDVFCCEVWKLYERKRLHSLLLKAEYLTEENYNDVLLPYSIADTEGYYKALKNCEMYAKHKPGGMVTGLWYISCAALDDGGVMIIYRTAPGLSRDDEAKATIAMWDHLHYEMSYHISGDDYSHLNSQMMQRLLETGQVYTVFDTERESVDQN